MHVYYNPTSKCVYLVPNHYGRSLKYIKDTLEWAKTQGLTVPTDDSKIQFEILAGDRHARMLSIEFDSETEPNCEYTDLIEYPHMFNNLKY